MGAADGAGLDAFSIRLAVTIRPCREEDLPALDALGRSAAHAPLLHCVYAQHAAGEAVMLVAEVNGEAVGQLWIELQRRRSEHAAEIWAVRVLACLQGQGIGARLMRAAEDVLRARGVHWALVGVETGNPRARRLYERLGYALVASAAPSDPPEAPDAPAVAQWVLRKDLRRTDAGATGTTA